MDPNSKRRAPLGKAIVRTDEELDQLAQITVADIELAGDFWRQTVTGPLSSLLDAKPYEAEPDADAQ